jgi:uncharacterized protein (TIGR03000 family)
MATGAALAVLLAASAAPAQYSTGYYGGGDYRLLYGYFPDRPPQWPGFPDYFRPHLVRETIVIHPASQTVTLAPPPAPVTIDVIVPADAELWIEGKKMTQVGPERKFMSPALESGRRYTYDFRIRFKEDGREQTKTRTFDVLAGNHYKLDFVNPPKTPARVEEFPAAVGAVGK